MPIPDWTSKGYLPAGRHAADRAEIYERLVAAEENRQRRELLYSVAMSYLAIAREYFPTGRAWISGELTERSAVDREGVTIAILPGDWQRLVGSSEDQQARIVSILSVRDVIVGCPGPMYLSSLDPLGGALSAYLVSPAVESNWHEQLSTVLMDGDAVPGSSRGYVEVVW